MGGREGSTVKVGALVLRAFAVGVAAMCIAWGIAPSAGIAAATVGAIGGVIAGEVLGRSRVRLVVSVGGAVVLALGAFWLASVVVGYEGVARALGTSATLRLGVMLQFGVAALAGFGAMRAVAARRPPALVVELGAIAGSIAYVFAAHRDGIISRPLWLSDWAWERGIDPANVFLVIGGVAVVVLGLLLVAEADDRRGSAAGVLALFAVLGVVLIVAIGPPKAEPDERLGLTSPDASGSASASAAPAPPSPPRPPSSAQPDGGVDGGAQPQDQGPDGGAKPQDGDDGGATPQTPDGGEQTPQNPDGDGGATGPQPPPDGGATSGEKRDGGDGATTTPPPASEQLQSESDESNESPSPMAVVLFDNDYSAPSQYYYFRQEVWSQWNGTKLVGASRADVDLDGLATFPTEPGLVKDVVGEAGREVVKGQVALLVEHKRPFALEAPVKFWPLANPNPSRFARAYGFESRAQKIPYKEMRGRKAGDPAWSDEVRAYYLQTDADPRFAELAKAIHGGMPERTKSDPFVTALAVKLYLDENFKYSRKQTHAGVGDPTADFLFGNRIGYCVHFAHAAVLLWRALGIPSRVATGYAVEEANRQGGSAILLRGADAHAWPELYLEGVGWVILDITPKETLDDQPPPVDDDLQRLLGEMARQLPPDPTKTEQREPPPDYKAWARAAGVFLGFAAAAMVFMLYLAKVWRRAAPLFAGPRALPRVGYRTSLDLLAEAGFARERGESREAFAERVRAKVPVFEKVTAMHLRGQMRRGDDGGGAFGEELGERRRAAWRASLAALRGELGSVPAWRRLLGFVNPLSFLRSR